MEMLDLKKSVLEHVDKADERLLKLMKALAESYEEDAADSFSLSDEQYQIIEKRRESYFRGESKSLSWEEVKANARKAAL